MIFLNLLHDLSEMLLGYISPHLERGALQSSLDNSLQIEVLMRPYTNYAGSAVYADYTAGTLRSTSCSSLQRVLLGEDNALRGICVLIFTIHRHQYCGGYWHFVWNPSGISKQNTMSGGGHFDWLYRPLHHAGITTCERQPH